MLKRIGSGIFLIIFSNLLNSAVEFTVGHEYHMKYPNVTSTSDFNMIKEFPVSEWLLIASLLVRKFGLIVTATTSADFFMAQAPCQVRGFVASMCTASSIIVYILRAILHYTFSDSAVFQIIISILMLALLPLFILISKWYKLRKRDDIIPYHMFAEQQFESNYRQKREWWRRRANSE